LPWGKEITQELFKTDQRWAGGVAQVVLSLRLGEILKRLERPNQKGEGDTRAALRDYYDKAAWIRAVTLLNKMLTILFFFFISCVWYWGLNSGPCAC
jgi:hypothetical protein